MALLIGLALSIAIWEAQTSSLQSWFFGRWSARSTTTSAPGRAQRAYGNPHFTIADFGYLLNTNPLELWSSGELARNPQTSWNELLTHSLPARHIASEWLFKTRNRKAQDLRLRIRVERDAFARVTPYWRKLGFPFDELVPSYATAIGSSADRPLALAELMGIIVNDGWRNANFGIDTLSVHVICVRGCVACDARVTRKGHPGPTVSRQRLRKRRSHAIRLHRG